MKVLKNGFFSKATHDDPQRSNVSKIGDRRGVDKIKYFESDWPHRSVFGSHGELLRATPLRSVAGSRVVITPIKMTHIYVGL